MKQFITALFIACISLTAINVDAQQLSLQQAKNQLTDAKAQGWVGERPDGYLGVVQASPTAEQIAKKINAARRSEYIRIAEENDIAVADVELLAGKRAIEKTQSGHYIKIDGQWKKKP